MALDWLPILPDLPRQPSRPPWRQWTSWRFPIVVPDLLASEIFSPNYPDRAPSQGILLRPAERASVSAALFSRVISPLDWYQQRPDQGSDRRLSRLQQRPAGDPPPAGQMAVVAASLAWHAQLPDQWPPRRSIMPEGLGTPRFVQPLIPIGTSGCAEWGPESCTVTDLVAQACATTNLINEALTVTTLTTESLC